jgi:hypothetical protein
MEKSPMKRIIQEISLLASESSITPPTFQNNEDQYMPILYIINCVGVVYGYELSVSGKQNCNCFKKSQERRNEWEN